MATTTRTATTRSGDYRGPYSAAESSRIAARNVDLVRLYKSGENIPALARLTGLSQKHVIRIIRAANEVTSEAPSDEAQPQLTAEEIRDLSRSYGNDPAMLDWIRSSQTGMRRNGVPMAGRG